MLASCLDIIMPLDNRARERIEMSRVSGVSIARSRLRQNGVKALSDACHDRQGEALQEQSSLYTFIVGGYVAVIVISIAVVSKFISIGPWTICGGTLIWPMTFVFNDIFTEVYGYRRSRKIIWTGMAVQLLTALCYGLVAILPAAPFWHDQDAYDKILGQAPRIVAANLACYIVGEWLNSVAISRLKHLQKGRLGASQCLRFVASTALGELADTLIFFPLAFVGVVPILDLLRTMATIYAAKIIYEILSLPASTRIANYIKVKEGIDVVDDPSNTDYGLMPKLSD